MLYIILSYNMLYQSSFIMRDNFHEFSDNWFGKRRANELDMRSSPYIIIILIPRW